MDIITNEQIQYYDHIRNILRDLYPSFLTGLTREAVQRSARRLEISEGDSSLLINTAYELTFFYEYCFYNYKNNGLKTIEIAYNKLSGDYSGEKLELFTKIRDAYFGFFKVIELIDMHGIVIHDALRNKTHKLIDKGLHKTFLQYQKNSVPCYVMSYMLEFDDFMITTGASVPVAINSNESELLYERFRQYLVNQPVLTIAPEAQYLTDMHKIALHEGIVGLVSSEAVPFGEEALEARVMTIKTVQ